MPELLRRLGSALDGLPGGPHEIVLVDDGSTDRTRELLAEAAARDPRIVAITLSRNFGHQTALTAALDHVTGDLVVVMDGDLQDAPEVIPLFLAEQAKGFDVVYAQRVSRKEAWLLRACYFLAYRVISTFSNVRLPLDAGDFGVLTRRVVEHLKKTPEHYRYLRGLRAWVGFRQIGIPVERRQRVAGKSKYSFLKLLRLAFDGLFAFSIAPLRVAAIIGLFTIAVSFLFAMYFLFEKLFFGAPPRGFTALILAVTFLSGVQFFFLGIIGEYVGRIYEESKRRPQYIIESIRRQQGDRKADSAGELDRSLRLSREILPLRDPNRSLTQREADRSCLKLPA